MPVRLFVSNLPYNVTEAELRDYFAEVGALSYLSLPTDRETGKPRGFAFVEFNERALAEEAVRRFNNQLFKGRPLSVNEARPREERPASSAPYRPAYARSDSAAGPSTAEAPSSEGRPSRNFGPDATPRRARKGKGGARPERDQRGPMRERVRSQFFGGDDGADDEDDDYNGDDFNDFDNEPDEDIKNETENEAEKAAEN